MATSTPHSPEPPTKKPRCNGTKSCKFPNDCSSKPMATNKT